MSIHRRLGKENVVHKYNGIRVHMRMEKDSEATQINNILQHRCPCRVSGEEK